MSASREKKFRQDQSASGAANPRTARELEQLKAEKRTNLLYGIIGVLFAVVVVVCLVWKSNIIPRNATAVTVDGEKYTAAELNYYYQSVYRGFLQSNSYFISYLGLNTGASLKEQTVNATAASMLGVEEGSSWYDYFMDNAIRQMTMVREGLKEAEAQGYQFSAGVQAQYEESMKGLKDTAAGSGTTVSKYLAQSFGSLMTEKLYGRELLHTLQYQAYASDYALAQTYTDSEIQAAYEADTKSYDRVSWEYVTVSGAAETTTDAQGNTVAATEEETAAAKEAAKETADAILSAYESGTSLEDAAKGYEKATYYDTQNASYSDTATGNWIFDDSRTDGDAEVLEVGSTYYVAVFHKRYQETSDTVDVRHILIQPEAGTLSEGDDGYEEEQASLMADAKKVADDLLDQWKNGAATEDSFAELANENSSDTGSNTKGGLYTQVYQGEMVSSFNDWCFDPSRQPGDTGVIETTYGYHVMYFVGTDIPYWQVQVTNTLQNNDYTTWYTGLTESYTAEQHSFGVKFVG